MNYKILFCALLFTGACSLMPQERSTFNYEKLQDNQDGKYSFFVAGHLYGKQHSSLFPANNLSSGIGIINKSGASFFAGLGDIVRESDSIQYYYFKTLFTDNLNMPFFNAPGNHEMQNRNLYQSLYGKTFFEITYGNDLFIFLDTELDSGRFSGEQGYFLENALRKFSKKNKRGNIFLFMHKLIWNSSDEMKVLYEHCNQQYAFPQPLHYFDVWEPMLSEISRNNSVYIFSGDIGTENSFTFFYHKDRNADITYVANGLGDREEDMLTLVQVSGDGEVSIELISLTSRSLKEPGYYGLKFWNRKFKTNDRENVIIYLIFAAVLIIAGTLAFRKKNRNGKKIRNTGSQ